MNKETALRILGIPCAEGRHYLPIARALRGDLQPFFQSF